MKDFLVVGLGLAGMAVVEELKKRNKRFLVFENDSQKASRIAGGVMNPVILKRFTKAWKADEFMPVAEKAYQSLEKRLGVDVFQRQPIYRKFTSIGEQNDWFVAADNPDVGRYLDGGLATVRAVSSDFGYGKVNHTSILRTEKLLAAYRDFLERENELQNETFAYDELQIEGDTVRYKTHKAKKIIFCDGFGMLKNPYFRNLPLRGNKGEYLIVKAPDLELDVIVKSSFFLMPLEDGHYKIGATYNRQFTDQNTETEARRVLIEKLEELVDCPYEIVGQSAGVRPTVSDRRPLLGRHPKHKNLLICNGFGSHGVMIAPTAAKWLLDFSENDRALPKEVAVSRFS